MNLNSLALLLVVVNCSFISGSHALVDNHNNQLNRRDALASAAAVSVVSLSLPVWAANEEGTIDMEAINAARSKSPSTISEMVGVDLSMPKLPGKNDTASTTSSKVAARNTIVPFSDPPPLLSIRGGINGKSNIKIPRVGYSLYKTAPDQVVRASSLALLAGVRHLDVGTAYGSNAEVAKALKPYLDIGATGLKVKEEKPELLDLLDATSRGGEEHAKTSTISGGASGLSGFSPAPQGAAGRRGRREDLFVSHKISNTEQSTDPVAVRRSVKAAIGTLGCLYLDMVSLHSPLTDKARRLESYKALLDLRDSGFVKAVGVCNYGVGALQELLAADVDLPAVNQLELSPFNQHRDVVEWCNKYGVAVSCSAWSKLSSADGPTEGWNILAKLAQQKGMTKAQVMVRWALQKGYLCVPRSASASKVERGAIAENSYGGVNANAAFTLTAGEMLTLDRLDVSFPAGKLGRRDGWEDTDVTGPDWDPISFI